MTTPRALVLVDLQKDFIPKSLPCGRDGSLAVPEGDQVIFVANLAIQVGEYDRIVYTQDWHPKNHGSFASTQGVPAFSQGTLDGLPQVFWPDHCVQGTEGVSFHDYLITEKDNYVIIRKGLDPSVDSYSAFFDNNGRHPSSLTHFLLGDKINNLDIMGLATDFCVLYTVLDALKLGYNVRVVSAGCRAVGGKTAQTKALEEMKKAGAIIL